MFAHLTIAVRDARASAEFFQRTLGWRIIRMPSNIDIEAAWVEVAPGQQVHILTISDYEPSPFEAEFGRHFAFFHPGADFSALKQRLAENGAEVIAAIRPTLFERFFFRDPNGYFFEIINKDEYATEK
jgi:catechol 2,3-dioxygenase-like lactoylglutathione lyase family enzyme